jgi:hypothetical protein
LGIYTALENKWYDFIEWANKFVPIAKVTDTIDQYFPSFIVFLSLFLIVLVLLAFGILSMFQTTLVEYQVEVSVSSVFGGTVEGALLSIIQTCNGEEETASLLTNKEGKVFFTACSGDISVLVTKEGYSPYNNMFDLINDPSPKILLEPKPTLPEKVTVFVTDTKNTLFERASLEAYCTKGSQVSKIFDITSEKQTKNGFEVVIPKDCTLVKFKAESEDFIQKEQTLLK